MKKLKSGREADESSLSHTKWKLYVSYSFFYA